MEPLGGSKQEQTISVEPKKMSLPKTPSEETDNSKSMNFDSMSDCGYKSGEISSQMSISGPLSSLFISESGSGKSDQTSSYDSGMISDLFSTSSEIYSEGKEDESKASEASKVEHATKKFIWSDVFSQDKDGDTILHLAIVEARSDVIFPLIRLAPHPDFLDITNNLFQTLLHLATLTGKSHFVRRLVASGATLDIQDHAGNTPLHIASRSGDLDCVNAMLQPIEQTEINEVGCSYQLYLQQGQDLSYIINMKNYDGQSCVHLAAEGGYLKVMESLYNNNADMDDQDGKTGRTALHYSVENGNYALVKVLLSRCDADPRRPNYAGQTPFRVATSLRKRHPSASRKEILDFLTAHNAKSSSESGCSSDEVDAEFANEVFRDLLARNNNV